MFAEIITASAGYKYTNGTGSDILAGSPVVNSKLFGFAAATIAAGAQGWIETTGVWRATCGNTTAANVGDIAYWDATNSVITATASTNLPVGYFVKAVTSGQTTCEILLGANLQAAAAVGG